MCSMRDILLFLFPILSSCDEVNNANQIVKLPSEKKHTTFLQKAYDLFHQSIYALQTKVRTFHFKTPMF